MMKRQFSYLRKGNQYYPLIDIELTGPKGSLTVKALVDSGASLSVFRPEIANYLAIPIKKGEGLYFQGIKGQIRGYLHRVPVRVSSEKFDCNIAFSPELCPFGRSEKNLNFLGGVGPLERVPVIPGHPTLKI